MAASIGLGTVRARTGRLQAAADNFRAVLRIEPKNPVACNNLAWLLADQRLVLQLSKGS